jgi:hypothetical protein
MAQISAVITYEPSLGGNWKKPEAERFSVKLKAARVGTKQSELRKFINTDAKKLAQQMMSDSRTTEIVELLKQHFICFVNFDYVGVASQEDVDKGIPKDYKDKDKGPVTTVNEEYRRAMTIDDLLDLGEYQLLMEIFMFLVGSSQLQKVKRPKDEDDEEEDKVAKDKRAQLTLVASNSGDGPTTEDEREDEEKN